MIVFLENVIVTPPLIFYGIERIVMFRKGWFRRIHKNSYEK
jgi:hypothetical protein